MNGIILFLVTVLPGAEAFPLRATTPNAILGDVTANKPLTQVFHLENTGSESVTITDVRRSCACAKFDLERKTLAPGQKAALIVSFNLLAQPEGPGQWGVSVVYMIGERGEKHELPLSVAAKVKRDVWVDPVALVMTGEKDLSAQVTVFDRRGKRLNVTGARLGVDQLQAKIEPVSGDGERRQTVQLTAGEKLPVGTFVDELSIDTDDPEYRELRIPVRIVKKSRADEIRASVDHVKLHGIGTSKLVTLRDRDDREIDIESLTAGEDFLKAKWARGPGNDATVRVTLEGRPEQESGMATLIVKTKLPLARTINILVEWSK